ncbi:MAG: hypothetical protein HZC40_25860, partial [Chloroflexi bacterium]|nr:hypothetical protein [Chloroflexota bacterium]
MTSEYTAFVRGTTGFMELAAKTPKNFIDYSLPPRTPNADYLFPWTNGQSWYRVGWGTPGWHDGNAIDFQPVNRSTPSIHFAVLAAAAGRLTRVCDTTSDPYQGILRIEHDDGATRYLHLAQNDIRTDLLGQNIVRGQFLGLLYNGRQGERDSGGYHYQYWTNCGRGTAVHLHFEFPRREMTIDGNTANNVANSTWGGTFRSSNPRVDGGGSTPSCGDGEGVVLYEHGNHQGRCSRYTGDDSDLGNDTIGNDAASSIRVIGNYEATVYVDGNYGGASSTFTADDSDMGNDTIGHDHTSSIRVRRRDAGGTSNCDGGQGVYLYEHSNYTGKCTKLTGDAPNPRNWYVGNDAVSSVRIIGNYETVLYVDDDYNGASSTFTGDDSDLGNDTIGHDRASSARVRARSSTGSSNCDGGNGVYLYEHTNYGGRCSKFTTDTPNPNGWYIGNDNASSVRIIGNYETALFEHDNYNGASSSYTADDPDLG